MDHFVPLDRLPDGLQFPPDLRDRIQYDAAAHRLIFHGFMSKTDYDRLFLLSEDWPYRRRLEELFRLSTPDELANRGWRKLFGALRSFGSGSGDAASPHA